MQSLKEDEPKCFISYAWGKPDQEALIHALAADLKDAGIHVYLDIWHNTAGTSIAQFAENILEETTDFVVLAGSRKLMEKYNSTAYSVVKLELGMIAQRATGPIHTILPILLEDSHKEVLPKFLWNTVSVGFQNRENYALNYFNLLGRLYKLPTDDVFLKRAVTVFQQPDTYRISSPLLRAPGSPASQKLSDIKELKRYIYKGNLEVTPLNYQSLHKVAESHSEVFQQHGEGLWIKNWKASLGFEPLLDLLQSFEKVRRFKVQVEWDQEGDISEPLARALQFYEELTDLDLSGCKLNDEGVWDIMDALPAPKKLRSLHLQGNNLADDTLEKLKSHFPDLKQLNGQDLTFGSLSSSLEKLNLKEEVVSSKAVSQKQGTLEEIKDPAVRVLMTKAQGGDADAQYELGEHYETGKGLTQDEGTALEWYFKACNQNHIEAQMKVRELYQNNQGFFKDETRAFNTLKQKADQGDSFASVQVATMYRDGKGTAQNHEVAYKLYLPEAQKGNIVAQVNVGLMYENGWGVARDYEKAVFWYR